MKKYLFMMLALAIMLPLVFGISSVTASGYICPSCGKNLNYDNDIKRVSRMSPMGFCVMDTVMYCPYCGYNTERDSMGNIKLHVVNLWESRFGVDKPSCGCSSKTVAIDQFSNKFPSK